MNLAKGVADYLTTQRAIYNIKGINYRVYTNNISYLNSLDNVDFAFLNAPSDRESNETSSDDESPKIIKNGDFFQAITSDPNAVFSEKYDNVAKQTNTTILVLSDNQIQIKGLSREDVCRCWDLIRNLPDNIAQPIKLHQWTHFVCFPLNHNWPLRESISRFHCKVSSNATKNDQLISPCDVRKIHLTLFMLVLDTEAKLKKAIEIFNGLGKELKKEIISFEGVSFLTDEDNGRILVTKPRGLRSKVDVIIKSFLSAGLMTQEEGWASRCLAPDGVSPQISWHLTLFRNQDRASKNHLSKIAQRYSRFIFGKATIASIALCKLNSTNASDGFYQIEAVESLSLT